MEAKGNVEPVLLLPESDHLLEHLEFPACIISFILTAKSRNLRIKVTLGHLLLFLFREQTVFSVVNILRQTEPLKSRHGGGV